MIQFATPISPCVSVCKLDKRGVCEGCLRTVDEIRTWYTVDDAGKQKILEDIDKRKSHGSAR